MAQYVSYDMVGIKEDVSDVISNITPTKTPFQSMIGSEKVHNKFFQWQEDELRAVQVNAKVEGFTAADSTRTPTALRSNYTQILSDTIKVSNTADAVSSYGRAKESAYQMAKVAAELKRDLEHAYVGMENAAVAGDSVTPREMASFFNMVDSSMFTYTGGTSTKPDEADVLDSLQKVYDEGADVSVMMVTPTNSLEIADFAFKNRAGTSLARERDMGSSTKVVNVVDVYVSPFGQVRVVLNRFLLDKRTILFDPEMWKKITLRGWTRETLAKTGDNVSMMLTGEFSLKHKNFKASAVIEEDAS
jgi:hypothetical protein